MKDYELEIFRAASGPAMELPYANAGVAAGFPSPAQDYLDDSIDLNKVLVRNAPCTFYARVRGDSLIEDDICDGDIVVIDKSLEPRHGDLAVCALDGEFTLKYLDMREQGLWLRPANTKFAPVEITEGCDFEVWGVVTYTIKKIRA